MREREREKENLAKRQTKRLNVGKRERENQINKVILILGHIDLQEVNQ